MISQDQIVFASENVQDFGDFQIPAGGKVVISVSIVANPISPSEPGTYKGKILVVIPDSTELTVPIIVDLKPSETQILCSTITVCALTEPDTISYLLATLPTSSINFFFSVIGATGIIGFFSFYITYRGAVNANSAETRAARQDAEREEDRKRELEANSQNKLNIDLKYRIYRVDHKGYIVILPSIENIGANNVSLWLAEYIPKRQEASPAKSGSLVGPKIQLSTAKGATEPTELSIEACDSISNLKFLKGGQPVTFVKWTGEECTGSNSLLRKGEKMPPNEKFVEFTGNGIFKVKLVVTNVGERVAWPAEVYGSTAETPPTQPKQSPGPTA
jgi:hypothetical protein